MDGDKLSFAGCRELLIVVCGGTDYSPDAAKDFREPGTDPLAVARAKIAAAAKVPGNELLKTHVSDYHRLYNRFTIDLGESSALQRSLDSWSRIAVRYTDDSTPDPELEAAYVQYGRYLTITGSRDWLPMNLQGIWVHNNNPDWYADYHTDINVQMNYWLADPAGLGENSLALARYCVSQLPVWTDVTKRLYNSDRNRFRNSSGKIMRLGGRVLHQHPRRQRLGLAPLRQRLAVQLAVAALRVQPGPRVPGADLPGPQGRGGVLAGAADHHHRQGRGRNVSRGPDRRHLLVAGARS